MGGAPVAVPEEHNGADTGIPEEWMDEKRASPVGQDERGQEGASRQEREETPAASIGTRQENLLQTVIATSGRNEHLPVQC